MADSQSSAAALLPRHAPCNSLPRTEVSHARAAHAQAARRQGNAERRTRPHRVRAQTPAAASTTRCSTVSTSELDAVIDDRVAQLQRVPQSPRTRNAGPEFADPDFDLSLEWLEARDAIRAAERGTQTRRAPSRILVINGSSRSDQTCPGEMSKTVPAREARAARDRGARGASRSTCSTSRGSTSEYGRVIYPCKACVSTAMPLCHWPCSCYPNHALGQAQDWMNEIYPRWVAAHGVMIVHARQLVSGADGAQADDRPPRLRRRRQPRPDDARSGKDPAAREGARARRLGLSASTSRAARSRVVVHGDAAGVERRLRRARATG